MVCGQANIRREKGGGKGAGSRTKQFGYQTRPDEICPIVNVVFSHYGLEGGGGGGGFQGRGGGGGFDGWLAVLMLAWGCVVFAPWQWCGGIVVVVVVAD